MHRRTRTSTSLATLVAMLTFAACSSGGGDAASSSTTVPMTPSSEVPAREVPASGVPAIPGLDPRAIEVMNQSAYANAVWAVSVTDLDTGEPLIRYHDDLLLEPGSVGKTYSTGAAWLEFGPDSTITTPVVRTGDIVDGALDGDLVLVAQGDVTMGGQTNADGSVAFENMDHNDANALPGATIGTNDPLAGLQELATDVRASGIEAVTGQVVIDDRLWETVDLGHDGPVSPIVINNNLIDVVATPTSVGQPATVGIRPVVQPWTVRNEVTTVAAGTDAAIEVDSAADGTITVSGTVAAGALPVLKVVHLDDPATFARTAFIEALQRAGVRVDADPLSSNAIAAAGLPADTATLAPVASLESLPLSEQITYILKVSYNRGAQTMICLLAAATGSTDCDDGWARVNRLLSDAGLDPDQAVLIDGSGLPGNLITANSQIALQEMFAARPDAERWREALPILGVDGSLSMVEPDGPAKGKVFAKTGSLIGGDMLNNRYLLDSKALGGYIDAASGRRLAFTIIVTNGVFADIEGVFQANSDVGKVAAFIQQSY